MVKVNVPERITEPSILSLLNSKVPSLGINKIRRFDFAGRESLADGDYETALYKKIIAAKLYGHNRNQHPKDIFDAARCYDRASKIAYKMGFDTVDFRCVIRSALLHHENLTRLKREESRDGLDFAIEAVWNNFTYKLITSVYSDNHVWFPQLQQEAA